MIACARLIPIDPSSPAGTQAIDRSVSLEATGAVLCYDVRSWSTVSVQGVFSATASTAVLTVKRSNDGANFVALESATTITPAAPMTTTIDCTGFGWLSVSVTTADTGDTVSIHVLAKASD